MTWCERCVAYLRPDLSHEEGLADVELSGGDEPILRDLGNGLLVAYLVDEGDHFQYVQRSHLDRDGLDADALHTHGIANLNRLVAEHLNVYDQDGYYACIVGGNFEASLLLLDDLWDTGLAHVVTGDFIACIPAREILGFADSAIPESVDLLKAVVDRVWDGGDHLISRSLYIRRGSSWELRS